MRPLKLSRTARRMFRPLHGATEPMPLNLYGLTPEEVLAALHEVGDMVRATDAPTPFEARYVCTAGSAGAFAPTRMDRLREWWRGLTWWVKR